MMGDKIDDTTMSSAQASGDEKDCAGGVKERSEGGRLLSDVLKRKPRYIGVYAPGDFASPLYRLVIPNEACDRWGRGYMGAREEVIHEARGREGVDALIKALREISGEKGGPIAIRHILNPSTNKDEGIRLIWPRTTAASKLARDNEAVDADADTDEATANRSQSLRVSATPSGAEEMADWPRRDKMIQEGKTVQAEPDSDVDNDADFAHLQARPNARVQGYTPTGRFVQGYSPHMLVPFYSGNVHIPQPMIWGGHDGGLFVPLQMGGVVMPVGGQMPPPYYSPVSALSTLDSDDPISPVRDVSPLRLDQADQAGKAGKAGKVDKADGGLGSDAMEMMEIEGDLMV